MRRYHHFKRRDGGSANRHCGRGSGEIAHMLGVVASFQGWWHAIVSSLDKEEGGFLRLQRRQFSKFVVERKWKPQAELA
jgi:hypothetical protein